jgi:hypothetical protein
MKTKFVKLGQGQLLLGAEAAAGVAEGLTAEQVAGSMAQAGGSGVSGPSPVGKFVGQAAEEGAKSQYNPAENLTGISQSVRNLKDFFVSNGFGLLEFDSYLADYFNAPNGPKHVEQNPKTAQIPTTTVEDLMELAVETKNNSVSADLKIIFNSIIDLFLKTLDFNTVKDVITAATKLDAKVPGSGLLQTIFNAIHGDIAGSNLIMLILPQEDMRIYNDIISRALGHKLAKVEEIVKSTEKSKLTLQKATEELGLVRGVQVAIESQQMRAIEEGLTKQLTGMFRHPVSAGAMSLARRAMMLLHVYSNIKDQFLGSVAPSTVPLRSKSSFISTKFVRLAQAPAVQYQPTASGSPALSSPSTKTPMGRPTNPEGLKNKLNSLNTPPNTACNVVTTSLLELNNYLIKGDENSFNRILPTVKSYVSALRVRVPSGTTPPNPSFIETAEYWLDQFTTTGSQSALFDPNDSKELIQDMTQNNKHAQRCVIVESQLKRAIENYDARKSNLYGGSDQGAGKLSTDVIEFGQAKKVPYNTAAQNIARLNDFKASVDDVIKLSTELYQLYAMTRSMPTASNLSPQQLANLKRELEAKIFNLQSQVEKWKAERVKVVSELATIKQTTKQKDIRLFGGSKIGKMLKMLADRGFGGYGMMGGVAQLNTLMAPLIQEQKDKIASIRNEMFSATSPEDQRAFQGQLQLAENELQELIAEGPNMLLQALEGKFDESKWSNAFASISNSKFIKTSKFNKEADERLEDYYNEEMDYSPYGTALEHPIENEGVLTEDIKPHKKSRYKKHKFQI